MLPVRIAPLLPSLLVGIMCGLLTWAGMRNRRSGMVDTLMKSHDGVVTGMAVLAVFALVTFMVYVILGLQP